MTYSPREAQAVKDYYADRLATMLAEAGRCGVSNTSPIKHKMAIQQDWAISNHLTVAQARFADEQYWVQVEELETTKNVEILTFATEFLSNEVHQQAIAKNPHTSVELLKQIVAQGSLGTMAAVAANPNTTDAMLEGLLEMANRTHGSVSGGLRNIWPEKTGADHKADGANELGNAVLRAQQSRKATSTAE